MPTKVKGMTSLEIAVLVGVVLAIAIAVAWYLYSTFGASIGSQPYLRVTSAVAFGNGTIRVTVINTGSIGVSINRAEVYGRMYNLRGGWIWVGPSGEVTVNIDTGVWARLGSIIHGRLMTDGGHTVPFSARVIG